MDRRVTRMNASDTATAVKRLASNLSAREISTAGKNYAREEICNRYVRALLGNPALPKLASVRPATIIDFIEAVILRLDLPPYGHVPYIETLLSNPSLATLRGA